jgi:hypothetical protein
MSGSRIPVGANVSLPVETEAGANPVCYAKGKNIFLETEEPGHGVDYLITD